MVNDVIRHVILGQPLRCFGQMMTARFLAEEHSATLHLTAGCIGEPRKKHPGMGSSCVPLDPRHGAGLCRHDLAGLRSEGAIEITDGTTCWEPDGTTCWCQGTVAASQGEPPRSPGRTVRGRASVPQGTLIQAWLW